ncbi:unnamed protein product [Discosporangium mesarthrocarpum]
MGTVGQSCPLPVRILISPITLVYYALRVYCFSCIGIYLRRIARTILRALSRIVCCGVGLTYRDKNFPPGPQSLGSELVAKFQGDSVQWKRADELVSATDKHFHLFSKGVHADDVKQGAVGDCWLVAAMSTLAASIPGAIAKLFINSEYSSRGKYKVRLFDIVKGTWCTMVIDDQIPTQQGSPIFAKPNGNELWVILLEKAIAKYCGSYSAISGGFEAWGLKVLTGNNVFFFRRSSATASSDWSWRRYEFRFKPSETDIRAASTLKTNEVHDSKKFWSILLAYAAGQSGAMCCSIIGKTVEGQRRDGLIELHAYSILRCVDLHGQKLIQIRNPWGARGEWKGAWSDGSSQWRSSPLIKAALKHRESNDGTFWMCWQDFSKVWSEITICARSRDASDLFLDVNEDLGCPGPTVGCVGGCLRYWVCCRGCRHVVCPVASDAETRAGRSCVGCVCCV